MARVTVADVIGAQLRRAFGQAIADAEPTLDQVADTGAKATDQAVQDGLFGGGFSLADLLLALPGVGEILTGPGLLFRELFGKAGRFVIGVASGWALGEFISEAMRPVWSQIVQDVNAAIPSFPLDAQTIARTAARGITGLDASRTEAARNGINSDRFNHLLHDAMLAPALAETLELLRRGHASDADALEALHRDAIDPKWHERLLELRRQLLSAADLALAELRGVLTPEQTDAYRKLLGVSAEDFATLIGNTGEPPGAQQLGEALRRGLIQEGEFSHGIRQSRIRNEWIPMLLALRFAPMSVADAARAVVQNYLHEEEGAKIARQNGLEPAHWRPFLESYGEPLSRTEMAELYHRKLASLGEFEQALRESRMKDKYVAKAVELSRRLIPYRTVDVLIKHGVISSEQGIEYLLQLGYNHEDAARLVATTTSTKTLATKQVSESMIGELYEAGSINHDQAVELLHHAGYDQHEAGFVLEVIDARRALAEQQRAITSIRRAFLEGRLTHEQAVSELDQLHVLSSQRERLLAAWQIEKRDGTRVLTPVQIADAVKAGIWAFDEAVGKLEALGYTANDAKVLISLHIGGVPAHVHIGPPGT